MQDVKQIIDYYHNISDADLVEHNPDFIVKFKQRKAQFLANQKQILGLDDDVATWLSHQDPDTKSAVNTLLKNLMQTQKAVVY
ncbi:hypothetical protein B0181_10005 [Moraxella caviae]|uniref:Uncharacterized protein n=1 Tax=Moraxella caviae TaxID=34060 RepID=A0A1S9ZW43_9GAMM|nr:hypothetical protein [Moraxella caviae]OOR87643.1 hypothetical protein B0181_10005 [Moraxella caviae]STZ10102.1 Uncharacterised protein [Moraxella caviae]